MAPIATTTHQPAHATPVSLKEKDANASSPLAGRSNEEFWKTANDKLVSFGGGWMPVRIVKAKGTVLYDEEGNRLLDWTSGQMSSLLGHGHPEIVDTVTKYVANLDHLFSPMVSDPVLDLAERLTAMLPKGLDKCLFLSTGSETNEAALKMAKMYTGGFEIVSLSASYHGMTHGAGAATFTVGRKGYGPQVPGNFTLPVPYAYRSPFRHPDGSYDWKTELDYGWDLIDRQSTGSLAACLVEPIVSTGGIITLPDGYLTALKEHCRKRNMLLIMDEAQTGMARTGDMFGFQHEGVVPDILTLSKTLGCGLPLGATITSNEIEAVVRQRGFFYLTTHLNDPLVCAVGAKVCEIVVREDMPRQAREKGELLRAGLLRLQEKYPLYIGDVRGRGLLQGIEIISDPKTKSPGSKLGAAVAERCMDLGLSCNIVSLPALSGVFRLAPPVTITPEEIEEGLQIMDRAFAEEVAKL
ncbi:putative aminotransferasec [Vanrija pseudolonga]|uniref:Purtative aminotransferasec n=1 Tax=Vanrija pseudolonga TaxID=143232 RepID=A0AAF1BRG9_9TREE|nr:purtative aminotransferasec [Vanrija pseudolonga]